MVDCIRVAKYYPGKPLPTAPPGYENILIHVADNDSVGSPLSPYVLKNEQGHLLENIWQFSKVYYQVSRQHILMSKHHPDMGVVWDHPAEIHMDHQTKKIKPAYWAWRAKGMANPYAVRYPNGFKGRHACVCSINEKNGERLNYIQARKQIYCAEYARLAPRTEAFQTLLRMLKEEGKKIQLVEVDGPDPTLTYPPYDQISVEEPGMLMTEETLRTLIEDKNKPFGHGFVIAALLMGFGNAPWFCGQT